MAKVSKKNINLVEVFEFVLKGPPKSKSLTIADFLIVFLSDDRYVAASETRLDAVYRYLRLSDVISLYSLASHNVTNWFMKKLPELLKEDDEKIVAWVLYLENANRTQESIESIRENSEYLLGKFNLQDGDELYPLIEPFLDNDTIAKSASPSPALGTFTPKSLKIAVSVSGQLRGYEQAFGTWDGIFGDSENEVYFFVNAWRKVGFKQPTPEHASRSFPPKFAAAYQEVCKEIGTGEFNRNYPNIMGVFETKNYVDIDDLKDRYQTDYVVLEDDDSDRFLSFSNAQKMYYMIQSGFDHVKSSRLPFDIFVRIRPDKSITKANIDWQEIYAKSQKERIIYSDMGRRSRRWKKDIIGDQFAAGEFSLMEIYSKCYTAQNAEIKQKSYELWPSEHVPHLSLSAQTYYHNIAVKSIPGVVFGHPLDPLALSEDMLKKLLRKDARQRNNTSDSMLFEALK